ncbi:MAG: EVE domain-containing protein [Pseudomonadota bacterium]
MNTWLMKSEPAAYSWDRLVADRRGTWDGVRNHQAANHLRAMRQGERAFFYHSSAGREIVGVMEIVCAAYPDPTDPTAKWVAVDVIPLQPAQRPVTLAAIKADRRLSGLALVRNSRLSVSPVGRAEWRLLCKMAGIAP